LTRELIAEKAGSLHEVWSEETHYWPDPVRHLPGDFVSLYLAYLNHVDPSQLRSSITEAKTAGSA
jgi:hypothetical protein